MWRVLIVGSLMLLGCRHAPGTITSFEECVMAGYPVVETYPRRCMVPNGPTFPEVLPPAPIAP